MAQQACKVSLAHSDITPEHQGQLLYADCMDHAIPEILQ